MHLGLLDLLDLPVVATELVLLTHNLKSFLAHQVLRDPQGLLDTREMLVFQELRAILADLGHKDPQENQEHQATLEKREHQATTAPPELLVNQAITERREHLATMVHLVFLVGQACLVKMVILELQDLLALKVKPVHQDTPSHPRFLVLLEHLDTLAKMELQVILVVLALLAPLALLDYKDLLVNLVQMAILVDLDLKVTLEHLATLEHLVRTDILVPLARSLALLDPKDLLDLLVTMAPQEKMVFPVDLVIQARTDFPALLDTPVLLRV